MSFAPVAGRYGSRNLFGLRRSNGGDHRFEITDTQRLIDGALRLVYQARVS